MNDFEKILSETKTQLNGILSKDSSKEQIDTIAAINKKLDSMNEAFIKQTEENQSLKETIIEQVKNTGFAKSSSDKDDSGADQNQKSIDEIMSEELAKFNAK